MKLLIAAVIMAGCSGTLSCGEQKYEVIRPAALHSKEELIECWTGAEKLSAKLPKLSPAEVLKLYQYEKRGFRSMNSTIKDLEANAAYLSTEGVLGVKYLKAHKERYREIVHEEFDTFVERFPSRALLDLMIKKAPDSPERWTIEWDLDYADFIRQFSYAHDGSAKGKTCEQYYDDHMKSHKELSELYSKEEIDAIKKDCKADRVEYKKSLKALFEKFKGKTVTPKLYDPDETNIVSNEYFGID